MSALVCDICGGNLAMDTNGEFAVCESCGMKHSKERVKVKVQEIQGTVKIDGAVETVKGDAEKERLLNNAENLYRIGEFNKGKEIYKQITIEYPNDYRGWLGLFEWYCRIVGRTEYDDKVVFIEEGNVQYDSYDRICQKANIVLSLIDNEAVKQDIIENIDRYFSGLLELSPRYFCDIFINRYDGLDVFKTHFENLYNEVLQYNELCSEFNSLDSKTKKRIAELAGGYSGVDVRCTYVYKKRIGFAFNQGFGDGERTENRKLQVPFKTLIENGIEIKRNEVNTRKSNNLCQHCGGRFKGILNKICSNCGKPKDY